MCSVKKIRKSDVIKSMKFTKLVYQTEINVLCTLNLQIFHEIDVPVIKFKKYLLHDYKII